MIKEDTLIINGHSSNYQYYNNMGYFVEIRKPFEVRTKDLMRGSAVKITTVCSICYKESQNVFKDYFNYTNGLTEDYFCNKCKILKSEKTCIEKYGVKNPMQTIEVKDTLKKSILKKYGVEHYSQTDMFKDKFKNTCNLKYGSDNPFSNNIIKSKIKKTINNNYGVDYPLQNLEIKSKSKETCLEKYGKEFYSQTEECKSIIQCKSIINYGLSNPMKSELIKDKVRNTNIYKYGVNHISKTENFKKNIKDKRERNTYKKYMKLLSENYDVLSYSNENFELYHDKCGLTSSIYKGLVIARNRLNITICTKCNPIGVQHSSLELELRDFLDVNNIEYIKSDRSVLGGSELDIYIPSFNIAIEMNGVYWHSELYKDSKYHINKTIKCREKNIELLHVWEDDWKNKNGIIKSIILNRLGSITNRLYARKCNIMSVNSSDARQFLNENHIQGFSSSSIKIGLYYETKLVSLMTFGYRFTNGKKEYELIRFCNKINYSIIGSASRLFKHFIKSYDFLEVISYSDVSMFNGNLYKQLGFTKISISKPNYFWIINGIRKHRFNFSKRKLINKGFDPNKTELEIMHECGYYRVFSCGQEKWIYDNEHQIKLISINSANDGNGLHSI